MEAHVRKVRGCRGANPGKPDGDHPSEDNKVSVSEDADKVRCRHDAKHNRSYHEVGALAQERRLTDVPAVVHQKDEQCRIKNERRRHYRARKVHPYKIDREAVVGREPPMR